MSFELGRKRPIKDYLRRESGERGDKQQLCILQWNLNCGTIQFYFLYFDLIVLFYNYGTNIKQCSSESKL